MSKRDAKRLAKIDVENAVGALLRAGYTHVEVKALLVAMVEKDLKGYSEP